MTIAAGAVEVWVAAFFWPFLRIGALFAVAPIIGTRAVSARIRLIAALATTLVILPVVPTPQPPELLTVPWLAAVAQELLIGAGMGFLLQIVFEAIAFGGQLIALGMGLGFAQMTDPLRGVETPVLGQFFSLFATLLFLTLDGHVRLIMLAGESFGWPPGTLVGWLPDAHLAIAQWGTAMFVGALQVALPAMCALLLVNFAFGVMSRSAPALNVLSVGLPAALIFGLLAMYTALPALQQVLDHWLDQAMASIAAIYGAG